MFKSSQSPSPTQRINGDVEPLITEELDVCTEDSSINTMETTYHSDTTEYVPAPYNDARALDGESSNIKVTLKGRWDRLTKSESIPEVKPEHQYGVRDLAKSAIMRNYTIYLSLIW